MYTDGLTLTRGGRLAFWLAVIAPLIGALVGIINVAAIVPADALWGTHPVGTATLAGLAVATALLASFMLHRGIRGGDLAPARIAALAMLPWGEDRRLRPGLPDTLEVCAVSSRRRPRACDDDDPPDLQERHMTHGPTAARRRRP